MRPFEIKIHDHPCGRHDETGRVYELSWEARPGRGYGRLQARCAKSWRINDTVNQVHVRLPFIGCPSHCEELVDDSPAGPVVHRAQEGPSNSLWQNSTELASRFSQRAY